MQTDRGPGGNAGAARGPLSRDRAFIGRGVGGEALAGEDGNGVLDRQLDDVGHVPARGTSHEHQRHFASANDLTG